LSHKSNEGGAYARCAGDPLYVGGLNFRKEGALIRSLRDPLLPQGEKGRVSRNTVEWDTPRCRAALVGFPAQRLSVFPSPLAGEGAPAGADEGCARASGQRATLAEIRFIHLASIVSSLRDGTDICGSSLVPGRGSFTLTVMAPVATPDDEKLYANYGETPFLEDVLSH
jgi:hypothetical protein